MSSIYKDKASILKKLKIEALNPMQIEAEKYINIDKDLVLLSPTGSGKTLAFLLPIINLLDIDCKEIQVLVLVPTRELAMQIEQVFREMGTGFKANAVYGGRAGSKDKIELSHRPAVLIGTPGRIADHFRKESFSTQNIRTLVLDEFDKSLEIGFEEEMKEIIKALPKLDKRILTSATKQKKIASFVGLNNFISLNYLKDAESKLTLKIVESSTTDPSQTLLNTLNFIGNKSGIVFCNMKETIQDTSDLLTHNDISHGVFNGSMEQIDRERALIKFRNGTHQILIATDLAARGIDIPEIEFIIHYQLPNREHEFTHRNGRTARMHKKGTAYIIKSKNIDLPEYVRDIDVIKIEQIENKLYSQFTTLYISGGRKHKISKGDIAGLFFKQGKLERDDLGVIELKTDCAYVAVKNEKVKELLPLINNTKLKTKKVRITIL